METAGGVGDIQVRVRSSPGVPPPGAGLRRPPAARQLGGQRRNGKSSRTDGGEGRPEQRSIPFVLRPRKVSVLHHDIVDCYFLIM